MGAGACSSPAHNEVRGHTYAFDRNGAFRGAFDFGWDVTPAVYEHDRTYSIVLKDNHYLTGRFLISQLAPDLHIEWSYEATNTLNCRHLPDGTVSCEDQGFPSNGA